MVSPAPGSVQFYVKLRRRTLSREQRSVRAFGVSGDAKARLHGDEGGGASAVLWENYRDNLRDRQKPARQKALGASDSSFKPTARMCEALSPYTPSIKRSGGSLSLSVSHHHSVELSFYSMKSIFSSSFPLPRKEPSLPNTHTHTHSFNVFSLDLLGGVVVLFLADLK